VTVAERYPQAPAAPSVELGARRGVLPRARDIYDDRWMFHGPAYRGIERIDALGREGVAGVLRSGAAIGSLLDSAAQLFGVWFMHELSRDRLAMPVRLARARFYGPPPAPGTTVDCIARVSSVSTRAVIGELTLSVAGRLWAQVEGWEARRIEMDDALWRVVTWPEKQLLSRRAGGDAVVFEDRYRSALTREYLRARYLRHSEREQLEQLPPARQRAWLSGRIAAKDAVRDHLWRRGSAPIFPAEILLHGDGDVLQVLEPSDCALRVPLERRGELTIATTQETIR
jgi:hypothetical protein